MYIRTVHKKNKSSDKVYTYYRLIHAYRIGDKRRQINILNLGKLEDLPKDKHKLLADRIEEILTGKESLFPNTDDRVEKLAQKFAVRIKKKGIKFSGCESKPVPVRQAGTKDYHTIDINSLEEEDIREVGAEWLSKQAIDLSGLPVYLRGKGYSEYQVNTMLISLICKMVHPSSELEAERWLKENTALCELYNLEADDINRHDLYRANNRYLKHKEEIEEVLYDRTFDLFSKTDRIIIYDLTNLYFEGRMNSSKKAKYGRCKSKRNDCKLIGLSMVVDIYGFVRHCDLYPGNVSEPKTLSEIIDRIEKKLSSENKPIVVIDAGIGTEGNLQLLRERGYDYISVSRQRLKEYQAIDEQPCVIKDKKGNKIELKKIAVEGKPVCVFRTGRPDCYLYVKSDQKSKKEESIDGKLTQRFEERLEYLKEGLAKPRRLKKIIKVHEHIGRLKEQYSSIAKLYKITYVEDKKSDKVLDIEWRREKKKESGHGVYFLRYSRPQLNETQIWNIYNCIREVESTFRCLKNDLDIRPIFHQKDEHIESHIWVGIIGYQIVNIIRQRLKAGGINHSWKTIVKKMNTQKRSIIEMDRKDGKRVYMKLCSRPNIELKRFYELMLFEFRPYTRTTKVVTQL